MLLIFCVMACLAAKANAVATSDTVATPPEALTQASVGEQRVKAETGDAVAQCNLGGMYFNGIAVAKDSTEAAKWYRKPA